MTIPGHDRLIVIIGMAHTGTTILAYLLRQHPDVVCCADGSEAWILENTWLPLEASDLIQRRLDADDKRLLLKRPWAEVTQGDWLASEIPDARYLYCLRSFEGTGKSWSKPTSLVNPELRDGSPEDQRGVYDSCLEKAKEFASKVNHFRVFPHDDLLRDPAGTMAAAAEWLDLCPFNFDVAHVSEACNIKEVLLANGGDT